jgi:AcrR family transcriptional regulator
MLSATLDAFYEKGYHGATVRDIARRVGVTVPALYYHHENKEAMLYALLEASIGRLSELCDLADRQDAAPLERFSNLVECLVRYTAVSGKLSYLDAEIRSLSPEHRRSYSAQRASIEERLRSALEAGVKQGVFEVDYPRDTVRALLGMIQAITTWFHPKGELSLDELVRRYLAVALRMVGAKAP